MGKNELNCKKKGILFLVVADWAADVAKKVVVVDESADMLHVLRCPDAARSPAFINDGLDTTKGIYRAKMGSDTLNV